MSLNLLDLTVDLPNDLGVEDYDPDAIGGGDLTPPQPGTYILQLSFPKGRKPEEQLKLGTNKEPNAPILNAMIDGTIIGIDEPETTQLPEDYMGRKTFNNYVSSQAFRGGTSRMTDILISAGIPKEAREPIGRPGGLRVLRDLFISVIQQGLPVYAYLTYEWTGTSTIMPDPKDPAKMHFISRRDDIEGMNNVPDGIKGISRDENGNYPTTQQYTHTWPDGQTETVTLRARLKIARFVKPPVA